MRVACCQFKIAWEDKPANYRRVEELVSAARLPAGTLLLLPEMFATGFTMNARGVAEPLEGPTARFLSDLAQTRGIHVLGGVVIDDGQAERPKNTALAFAPDGLRLAQYAKMHLFSYAEEPRFYSPGDAPVVFAVEEATAAPAICYDLRFPELFRALIRRSVDFFAVIACWPASRAEHWHALLRARAIENQCFVCAVNRCGADPTGLSYCGGSQIYGPRGELLADAGAEEMVIQAQLDLTAMRSYRDHFPALRDMRIATA